MMDRLEINFMKKIFFASLLVLITSIVAAQSVRHNMLRGGIPFTIPSLIQSKFQSATTSGSTVFTFTSTPAENDLMVLMSTTAQDRVQTGPSGWTFLASQGTGGTDRTFVWYKIAGASESNSYTVTIPGTSNSNIVGLTFRGYNFVQPVTLIEGSSTASLTTTFTAPSVAFAANKYIYAIAVDNSGSAASLSSASNSFTDITPTLNARIHVVSRGYTNAATSQQTTLTYGSAVSHYLIAFQINPQLK